MSVTAQVAGGVMVGLTAYWLLSCHHVAWHDLDRIAIDRLDDQRSCWSDLASFFCRDWLSGPGSFRGTREVVSNLVLLAVFPPIVYTNHLTNRLIDRCLDSGIGNRVRGDKQ